MPANIPEDKLDLLQRPIVCTLVTLMPDHQPQATPVWFSWQDDLIWVNTAKGRQKDKNMRDRRQVTVLVIDPENPYRYIELRGHVIEITEDGALDHIHQLARRYFGRDDFYETMPDLRGKETRVIFKIKPTHVK
jgi:PPOX class probable F420-dependent enzyme